VSQPAHFFREAGLLLTATIPRGVLRVFCAKSRVVKAPNRVLCDLCASLLLKVTSSVIMSRTADYEAKTESLLEPIAAKFNVTIYDVEYLKEGSDYILRAYIDKEGGVSINDCEAVSRALSDILDENDFIADAYILEVSSPGLGRQLKKDKHLKKSIGEEVEIKTYKPLAVSGLKPAKEFSGTLKSFDSEKIIIETEDNEIEDKEMIFNRGDIATVRLKFEFKN